MLIRGPEDALLSLKPLQTFGAGAVINARHKSPPPTRLKVAAKSCPALRGKSDESYANIRDKGKPCLRISSLRAKPRRAALSAPTTRLSLSTANSSAGPLSSSGIAARFHAWE